MKTKRIKGQYRQGDVLVERIAKINEAVTPIARENGRVILAHGEVTGHAHAIADTDVEMGVTESGVTVLDIAKAMAALTHDEHGRIPLKRGEHRVIRQMEYSPAVIRNVAD